MNWVFTWNNPDYDQEQPNVWEDVRYAVWQHEVGESGTPHYQGYVCFTKLKSLKQLVEQFPFVSHWDVRRGTHAKAKAYCMKEDSRTHGPFEYGEEPAQGKRNDLLEVAEYAKTHTMKDLADMYPADIIRHHRGLQEYKRLITPDRNHLTELIIFWGPPGTGKSTHVANTYPDAYWLKRSRTHDPWWDGYDQHETVVMDEFYGWVSVDLMTRLVDRFPLTVEVKGSAVKFNAKRIVITSNASPDSWWHCELHGMARRLREATIHHVRTPLWLAPVALPPPRPDYPTNELYPTEENMED